MNAGGEGWIIFVQLSSYSLDPILRSGRIGEERGVERLFKRQIGINRERVESDWRMGG